MHILENIGIEILNDEARQIFADAGCIVNGENVRFGRDFIMEMVAKAPSQFDMVPRNPDRTVTIGGNTLTFVNVSSPPNYYDIELGKKVSISNLVKDVTI